jgi:outer membrane murein-binding lipoprotein Lpp
MKSPARYALASLAGVMLLAGCQNSQKADEAADQDPALTGALGDQIMVDPDLAGQDGGAVRADGGQVELPPEQRSPEAIEAAISEAKKMVGGTMKVAPEPATGGTASMVESAATAAQVAQEAKASSTDCAEKVKYSTAWAAKLPSVFPVYPRGAVQEAAGTDSNGCKLRVVNFVTPVTPGDVIDFYYTRAANGGYGTEYRMDGSDHVLGGKRGTSTYLLYTRKLANGLTEVDLIASGG